MAERKASAENITFVTPRVKPIHHYAGKTIGIAPTTETPADPQPVRIGFGDSHRAPPASPAAGNAIGVS